MEKREINFSFVIPHKNLPDLLERCINSIPQRDDTEIIVVDDNSDPNKVDFKNFPGSKRRDVKIIYNTERGGAGRARNIGLENAKGKWLLFADCDDTYTEDLNAFLNSHVDSKADVVYFKANLINTIDQKVRHSHMNIFIDRFLNKKGNLEDIKFGAWEPWNKLINRALIVANNIRFDEISSSNDKMFSLRLGCYVRNIEVSPEILYNYILRKGSIVHSAREKRFLNSFNTIIDQNSLYHEQGYIRKVFIPFFLFRSKKYIDRDILKKYKSYLKKYKASPLEGFFNYFIFYVMQRFRNKG